MENKEHVFDLLRGITLKDVKRIIKEIKLPTNRAPLYYNNHELFRDILIVKYRAEDPLYDNDSDNVVICEIKVTDKTILLNSLNLEDVEIKTQDQLSNVLTDLARIEYEYYNNFGKYKDNF